MNTFDDSMHEILEARHYATLATHNADGSIHTTPVWYLFENGRFYVGCPSATRKARNATTRPNATIMVEVRRPGGERWVSTSGRVEILRGNDSQEINSRILKRYLTEEAFSDSRVGPTFAAADDMTICLVPEKWRSWSSMELDQQFFGGVLGREASRWFRPVDD